jgi:hypothetical protein
MKDKKIPDPARKDVVGVYYSQMKLWQGIAFVLAVAVVFLSMKVMREKYVYLYSDGLQVVKLSPTSPKTSAFLDKALKEILRISYATFKEDVKNATYYMTKETAKKYASAMNLLKPDFVREKLIFLPKNCDTTIAEVKKKVAFSAVCSVITQSIKSMKGEVKDIKVSGYVVKGSPNKVNLYPFRLSNLKLVIPP